VAKSSPTANYFHSAYATSNAAQSGLRLDQSVLGPLADAFGGRYVVAPTKSLTSMVPSHPIVVIAFDSIEKAQALNKSAAQQGIEKIRKQSTNSREFSMRA
jgi:uncharacterized protein (DUF1330 family)